MKNKTLYIITGGIASGKSTLSYNFIKHFDFINLPFVSTDVYYDIFFANNDQFDKYYDKARKYTDERLDLYRESGESFVWETVLSKEKKRVFIERCKKEGYTIVCLFVGLENPHTAVERSISRATDGDRSVSPDFVLDRYNKSLSSLEWISLLADTLVVFDNSNSLKLLLYKSTEEKYLADCLPDWVSCII